jgi:hypothetical protein
LKNSPNSSPFVPLLSLKEGEIYFNGIVPSLNPIPTHPPNPLLSCKEGEIYFNGIVPSLSERGVVEDRGELERDLNFNVNFYCLSMELFPSLRGERG